MKKILSIILIVMMFSFTGCSLKKEIDDYEPPIKEIGEQEKYNKLVLEYDLYLENYDNSFLYDEIEDYITNSLKNKSIEVRYVEAINNKLKVEIVSEEYININKMNDIVYEVVDCNYITFRDYNDNLLANGDEILKDIGASYYGETNYYGNPVFYLNIKDTSLLYEVTTQVAANENKHLIIWYDFKEGTDSYEYIETSLNTARKVIYNASVSEGLDDSVLTISGGYTVSRVKEIVSMINSLGKFSINNVSFKYTERIK